MKTMTRIFNFIEKNCFAIGFVLFVIGCMGIALMLNGQISFLAPAVVTGSGIGLMVPVDKLVRGGDDGTIC